MAFGSDSRFLALAIKPGRRAAEQRLLVVIDSWDRFYARAPTPRRR